MNDADKKKKFTEEYVKNKSKWSDKEIYGDYKAYEKPSWEEDVIHKSAPIESDYMSDSVRRKYTPEQQARLAELSRERWDKISAAEEALRQRGYERYRKKGQSSVGPSAFGFKNPITGKILRNLSPLLAKGITAGATGLASLAAEAADFDEEGSALEEAAMLREAQDRDIRKALGDETYEKSKQFMREFGPEDLLDKDYDKPKFRTLRKKLK